MGRVITGRKLWENGEFVGNCDTVFGFPCDRFTGSSPRQAWLIPTGGCCGIPNGYQLSMSDPNPGNPGQNVLDGVLVGVWLEFDGNGVLIDATTTADVIDECNACCDDTEAAVTAKYSGTLPSAADVAVTTFTFTRVDNGGVYDMQRAMLDYLGQYVEGTFTRTGYNTGTSTSTYAFSAYKDVKGKGADVMTETARTFDSNAPGAAGVGNHFAINGTINGVAMPELVDDAYDTLANLVTALTGNATWAAQGTYTVTGGTKIRLTSTSAVQASIVITIVAD